MRKLFDADGNEVEVPDAEELEKFKEASAKVERLSKSIIGIRKKLGLEKGQKIVDRVGELQQDANPNFAALRKKLTDQTSELEKAKALLKEHNIENDNKNVNFEDIEKNSIEAGRKAAMETLLENEINKRLSSLDETSRPVVKKYYDKLVSGEDVNLGNINNWVEQAINASGVEVETPTRTYADGKPPVFAKEGESFAETKEGQDLGKRLFGDNFGKPAEERQKGGEIQ